MWELEEAQYFKGGYSGMRNGEYTKGLYQKHKDD